MEIFLKYILTILLVILITGFSVRAEKPNCDKNITVNCKIIVRV